MLCALLGFCLLCSLENGVSHEVQRSLAHGPSKLLMLAVRATCLFALLSHGSARDAVLPSDWSAASAGDLSGIHLHITTIHDSTAMNMVDENGDMLPWQQWRGFQRDVIDWVARKAGFTCARWCKDHPCHATAESPGLLVGTGLR